MKRNLILKSIGISLCLAGFALIWFMQGCEKEIFSNPQTEKNNVDTSNNNLEILIKLSFRDIDNHALNNCNIKINNGVSCLSYLSESDTIDISLVQNGGIEDIEITVTKEGYLQHNFDFSINPTLNKGVLYYKRNIILAKRQPTVVVDNNGGIIKDHSGKFSLYVPKDALNRSVNISATQIPTLLKAGILEPMAKRLPLKTFRFEPDGLVFDKEVQVKIDISDISELYESDIYLGYLHEGTGEWEMKKGTISPDGNTASFEINHFSEWSIVSPYRFIQEQSIYKNISACGLCNCCNSYTYSCSLTYNVSAELSELLYRNPDPLVLPDSLKKYYFYANYPVFTEHGYMKVTYLDYYINTYKVEKYNSIDSTWEFFSQFTINETPIHNYTESYPCPCTHTHSGGSGF